MKLCRNDNRYATMPWRRFLRPGQKLRNRGNHGNHGNSSWTRKLQILPRKKRKTNTKANLIKFEKKTCKIKIFRDFRVFVLCPTAEYENSQITKMLQKRRNQFVIFNPLSYCFKETIGFNVKTSRAASRLIMWCN